MLNGALNGQLHLTGTNPRNCVVFTWKLRHLTLLGLGAALAHQHEHEVQFIFYCVL